MKSLQLDHKWVGPGHPCYVIAEIGSNHNRDWKTAERLIDAAVEAGCDAVKFQSYTADGLYSIYTPRISEMEGRSKESETPYELIKRVQMPVEWHSRLKAYCDDAGITFCSTPFDEQMVDVLEDVDTPFYKVASYEITHYPMLAKIAQSRKPVILSTGNSGLNDIERAVHLLEQKQNTNYALLHCVSQYPAVYADMNLRCLHTLRHAFDCVVGFSDHTTDALSSAIAVGLGAHIIEKHITLDKSYPGPDHPFSLNPEELKTFVQTIRDTESILGSSVKKVLKSEEENHRIGRRSLIAARDLKAGEALTAKDIVVKRPAMGLHPKYLDQAIGKTLTKNIPKDRWITWESLR